MDSRGLPPEMSNFYCLPGRAGGTPIVLVAGSRWVPVEALAVGDRVLTDDGRYEPMVSINQRTVNYRAHPKPESVWPVRMSAGAFGVNIPARDLYLSSDHAVFVNDVLVPVLRKLSSDALV
jgi:Hint domain